MSFICLKQGQRWELDPPYHPDDYNNVCLDEKLVEEVIVLISVNDVINVRVFEVIKKREQLHFSLLHGFIKGSDEKSASDELYSDYVKINKRWPHQERQYNLFYETINNGNWM